MQQLGPGLGGGAVAGAGGGDFSSELIDLIERTVQRDVWASAGGTASIAYFQPVHAIVVSAPESVHEDIARLLTDLRAAGP